MSTIWHNSGQPSFLAIAPCFDFIELTQIEALAPWEYMGAMYSYENNIRPIAHDWAIQRGTDVWERTKPWYCFL